MKPRSHYEVLGVEPGAPREKVRGAYRRKAMRAHPDRGGSAEEFHAIQRAHDVLTDPERRARYDATGDDRDALDARGVAAQNLGIIMVALLAGDVDTVDIVGEIRKKVRAVDEMCRGQIDALKVEASKMRRAHRRLRRRRGSGPALLSEIILAKVGELDASGKRLEMERETHVVMLAILDEYEYQADSRDAGVSVAKSLWMMGGSTTA